MNNIIEYRIVNNEWNDQTATWSLSEPVNKAISEGWQPFGSPISTNSQAMVRYEEPGLNSKPLAIILNENN